MGIDTVRGNIIKQAKKRQEDVTEVTNLKEESKRLVELAVNFVKDENYSSAFFIYYRALKIRAMLYMREKMGELGGLSEDDALTFSAQKGLLGLNVSSLESIKETVEKVLKREKIDKNEFQKISKVITALENEN